MVSGLYQVRTAPAASDGPLPPWPSQSVRSIRHTGKRGLYRKPCLIQTHMKTVLDTEKMIQEMNAASKNQTQYLLLDKEVGKLRRELSRISKRKSDLYEDYSERLITEEEYIQFSRIYSNEIENIKSRLDTVLAAQVRYSQDYHIEEGWGNVIHTYMSKRKLTKEMADAFVDSIIIHGKYDYEIKLVYDDQFADLQKLKKEKEAQSR